MSKIKSRFYEIEDGIAMRPIYDLGTEDDGFSLVAEATDLPLLSVGTYIDIGGFIYSILAVMVILDQHDPPIHIYLVS